MIPGRRDETTTVGTLGSLIAAAVWAAMFVAQGAHLDPITCIIHKLDMKSEFKVLKGFYSVRPSQ